MAVGDVTLWQYALVAATGLVTGVIGGVAGYGSALLLPLVLVPIIGPVAVVPVITVQSMFSNTTRLFVFRHELDLRKAFIVVAFAIPTTIVGAWAFTRLTGRGALILIGVMLIILVPVRRALKRLEGQLDGRRLAGAAVGYGLVLGGTSGAGVVLISMLMWAGLRGSAVIATDSAISLALGVFKIGTFQTFGALPLSSWIMAIVIGVSAAPGAFIARWLTRRMAIEVHTGILDGVVIVGGAAMIGQALRL